MKGLFFFVVYVFDCASVIIKFMYELIKYIISRVKEREKQRITKYVIMNFLKGGVYKICQTGRGSTVRSLGLQ